MLSHVWAWLRRTLGGRCTALTHFYLCPLIKVKIETLIGRTLITPLGEAVKLLNVEAINTLLIVSPSRSSFGLR